MAKKKLTMQTIADELGVTKVSVSKALNGRPGISDKLRDEIVRKAEEMGYKKLRNNLTEMPGKFAFIVPKRFFLDNSSIYSTIYYYLNKKMQRAGFELSLYVINAAEEEGISIPPSVSSYAYNGIFVAGEFMKPYMEKLAKLHIATVAIDFYSPEFRFDFAVPDYFYLDFHNTNYLIATGHKRIGFVGDIRHLNATMDKYYGYRKALESKGLPVNPDWTLVNNDPLTGAYHNNYKLPDPLPDAFVCHCDLAAYYLLQRLLSEGHAVPGDVSLIGFDNAGICTISSPQISSVDIHLSEYAGKAYDLMMQRLKAMDKPPQRVYIPAKMIIRETCAPRG